MDEPNPYGPVGSCLLAMIFLGLLGLGVFIVCGLALLLAVAML